MAGGQSRRPQSSVSGDLGPVAAFRPRALSQETQGPPAALTVSAGRYWPIHTALLTASQALRPLLAASRRNAASGTIPPGHCTEAAHRHRTVGLAAAAPVKKQHRLTLVSRLQNV